jgi:hypothetical protein
MLKYNLIVGRLVQALPQLQNMEIGQLEQNLNAQIVKVLKQVKNLN